MAFAFGFNVGPKKLGIDFSKIDSTAQHPVGTRAYDNKGRQLTYVKANGTIGKGNLIKAPANSDPFTNVVIATASAAATLVLGIAPQALAAGNFAWIVSKGMFEDDAVVVSSAVANGDPIVSDANGAGTLAAAADINNAVGICVVDDTDNTGSVYLF